MSEGLASWYPPKVRNKEIDCPTCNTRIVVATIQEDWREHYQRGYEEGRRKKTTEMDAYEAGVKAGHKMAMDRAALRTRELWNDMHPWWDDE